MMPDVHPHVQPVQLLLARNLIAATLTPAFVVDPDGVMIYFNEAAAQLIGRRFEESGRLTREEWNEIGPVDESGLPIASGDLPLTIALREGIPAIGGFRIKTDQGALMDVEASATPLVGDAGFMGAMVSFVPAVSTADTEPALVIAAPDEAG
jgi:PAS domain-containing protein